MRISSANRYDSSIQSLQMRQSNLANAQMQLTSGKRVNKPSDDPTLAARAERSKITQQRIVADRRAIGYSTDSTRLAESAMGQAQDVLQSTREGLLKAANGSYGSSERKALANELKQLRDQLFAQANQADGNGGYVFGGQGTQTPPFLDQIGGVQFAGTGGQLQLSTTEEMPISIDGQAVWMGANDGNGVFTTAAAATNTGSGWIDSGGVSDPSALTGADYSVVFTDQGGGAMTYTVTANGAPTALADVPYKAGASIVVDGMNLRVSGTPASGDEFTVRNSQPGLDPFKVLDHAIAVLSDANANGGQIQQVVSQSVRDLDQVSNHIGMGRSTAGSALQRLDSLDSRVQDQDLWAKSVQSDAEDMDMVQGISSFQNQQTSYQAALQSYAMVQKMSLFDYLK